MKLVEIIILAGTQCASPITPGHLASDVSKVPCAVVIERDTETRTVSVQPPALAGHPKVRLALSRPIAASPVPPSIPPSAEAGPQIAPTAAGPQPLPPVVSPAAPSPALAAEAIEPPPAIAAPAPRHMAALPQEGEDAASDSVTIPEAAADADAVVEEQEAAPDADTAESEPDTRTASLAAKPKAAEPKPSKRKPAAKRASTAKNQCISPARPVWYTNKSGQRKYRCARPGSGKAGIY